MKEVRIPLTSLADDVAVSLTGRLSVSGLSPIGRPGTSASWDFQSVGQHGHPRYYRQQQHQKLYI